MRARVLVEFNKPLVTGFWIPRKGFPHAWAMIYYEKLQDFCYKCGRLGHGQKDCSEEMAMTVTNPERPRYGPKLGVPPLKPLQAVMAEMGDAGSSERRDHAPRMRGETKRSQARDVGEGSTRVADGTLGKQNDKREGGKTTAYQFHHSPNASVHPRIHWNEQQSQRSTGKGKERIVGNQEERTAKGEDVTSWIKEKRGSRTGSSLGPSKEWTRIDLEEGKIRPGLGPNRIEELEIEKEDVGLKEPIIILDSLSPIHNKQNCGADMGVTSLDMDLSMEQIQLIRKRLRLWAQRPKPQMTKWAR